MRLKKLDEIRGIAVILMIIYHFLFDLNYFGIYNIDLGSTPLILFQRIIGITFIAVSGFSLAISSKSKTENFKRSIFLGLIAILITIGTWVFPHEAFIKFGIIHFMAISSIILLFFVDLGLINLFLGLISIGIGLYFSTLIVQTPYLFWLGLVDSFYTALDHYPLFPWIGIAFIGLFMGKQLKNTLMLQEKNNRINKISSTNQVKIPHIDNVLEKIGRNSLAIYLIHQPILIGILFLLNSIGLWH